jgi:hypothetical protein
VLRTNGFGGLFVEVVLTHAWTVKVDKGALDDPKSKAVPKLTNPLFAYERLIAPPPLMPVAQVAPVDESVPVLPLPEASVTDVPLPLAKIQYPIRLAFAGSAKFNNAITGSGVLKSMMRIPPNLMSKMPQLLRIGQVAKGSSNVTFFVFSIV